MNTFLRRTAGALTLALMLLAPTAGAAGPGGRYFLQGVMETGSELQLHADGRFEWSLVYGALDRVQRGRWSHEGDRVELVADPPVPGPSLLRVDAMFPWDADTEARLRDIEIDREGALAQERCPFLAVADAVSAPPMAGLPAPSPDALTRAARESLPPLENARGVAEAAAAAAVQARAYVATVQGDVRLQRDADQQMQLAIAAMEAYRANLAQARDAQAVLGLPMPALAAPRIPEACGAPSPADAAAIAAARPGLGLGVVVGDPAAGLRFSGIDVTFLFSDGHRETRTTNRGGWALLRPRPGARWQRVTLHRDGGDASSGDTSRDIQSTFAVDTGKGDLMAIALDSARLAPPVFERMQLRIEGEALVPTWPDGQERGSYVRE
ncbi:hypothetical protein [Lysobacter brunescens]|uniref:Uncharacterized protein n=1 Tax=Lysobacter brunescens TaxID=262323 RepID=A0ABW2Y7I9_9GAMM